jgi:hypothetical protein
LLGSYLVRTLGFVRVAAFIENIELSAQEVSSYFTQYVVIFYWLGSVGSL